MFGSLCVPFALINGCDSPKICMRHQLDIKLGEHVHVLGPSVCNKIRHWYWPLFSAVPSYCRQFTANIIHLSCSVSATWTISKYSCTKHWCALRRSPLEIHFHSHYIHVITTGSFVEFIIILAPSFKTIQMTHSYQKKPQNIVSNHKVVREKPLNFELVSVFYRFDLGVRKLCLHAHWKRCRSKPFSIAFRLATPFTIHFVRNCRNFAFFIRFVFARLEFFAQAFHEF